MDTLRQKFGPLPVWGWLLLVTGLLLTWYLYEQRKNAGSGASNTTSDQAPEIVVQTGGTTSPDQSTTPTPEPSPTGNGATNTISRHDRGPKVRRLEHQIYRTHQASEKTGAAKKNDSTTKPADTSKKKTRPGKTSKGAPARHLATSHPVGD